jgi:hypothetical protein
MSDEYAAECHAAGCERTPDYLCVLNGMEAQLCWECAKAECDGHGAAERVKHYA